MGLTYSSHYLNDLGTPDSGEAKKQEYQALKTGFLHINPSEYDELKNEVSEYLVYEGAINTPIIIDNTFWIVMNENFSEKIQKNYLLLEKVVPIQDWKGPVKEVSGAAEYKAKSAGTGFHDLDEDNIRGTLVICSSKEQRNWVLTGAWKLVTC